MPSSAPCSAVWLVDDVDADLIPRYARPSHVCARTDRHTVHRCACGALGLAA